MRRALSRRAVICRFSESGHNKQRGRPAARRSQVGRRDDPMAKLQHVHTDEEIRDAFRQYLKDHGIKFTSARAKILDAVIDLEGHFEADQVLYLLTERRHKVGKATVYRTIPLLVDCGILKQVRFDVKQAHYEHAFGEEPHDHMVCRRCGRIVEFASYEVEELRARIGRRYHFHVVSHRLQLSGLCWDCSIQCPVVAQPRGSPATGPSLHSPD